MDVEKSAGIDSPFHNLWHSRDTSSSTRMRDPGFHQRSTAVVHSSSVNNPSSVEPVVQSPIEAAVAPNGSASAVANASNPRFTMVSFLGWVAYSL